MNNYLNSWGTWINQIADDVTHQIDGGIQNVEQIVRTAVNNSAPGQGQSSAYFGRTSQNLEDILNQDKRPSPEQAGNSGNFFMGNGGISGSNSPTGGAPFCSSTATMEDPGSKNQTTKICDHCSSKFTFFAKKLVCSECRDMFCSNCVVTTAGPGPRSKRKLCVCCNALTKRPLVRSDLMELRVKDLQKHLVRKKISTKSCLEKKDLVELILRESNQAPFSASTPTSPSGRVPLEARPAMGPFERQTSFPKSYVESSHRREWFEKLDSAKEPLSSTENVTDRESPVNPEDEVQPMEIDIIEPTSAEPDEDITPVIPMDEMPPSPGLKSPKIEEEFEIEKPKEVLPNSEPVNVEPESQPPSVDGAVGGSNTLKPNSEPRVILPDAGSLSATSSPSRRFARQGLVRLDEIESLEDLNQLSAKQCKDLLAMNRVNFHGIIEKEELMKIVERLWQQDRKAQTEKDTMEDTDLCKICWDAPVDCVMLECGHMATCTKCGKQLAECPICRQYVVRVVRTFKA